MCRFRNGCAAWVCSPGYSDNPVMANYREYGFCDVLGKPYSIADVSRTLSSVLSPARGKGS